MPLHFRTNQFVLRIIPKPFLLVIPAFISAATGLAQEPWSLEQCISYAMENNIELKQHRLTVQIEENNLRLSRLSAFPTLNASANLRYTFQHAQELLDEDETGELEATTFALNSSVTLFEGFRIANTRRQSHFNLLATISDVEKLRNDLSLNIASAYLQILYSEEIVETAQQQVNLSALQVERTRTMVQAGSLPQGNLHEIEAQLASDQLQLVNARNHRSIAYLSLTQLLDLRELDSIPIVKPNLENIVFMLPTNSSSHIYAQAVEIMPQIKSANLRVASREKGLRIAKGRHYPRLLLTSGYNTGSRRYLGTNPQLMDDPFLTQVHLNANSFIRLSLSIPIFNSYQTRTAVSNALINLDHARLDLELEQRALYKEIQQAHSDAAAAHKKYEATLKNLSALELAFQHTEQKYILGLLTSFDYSTSKTRLATAQAELISAKYEFIFKTKILDFYKGIPLSL